VQETGAGELDLFERIGGHRRAGHGFACAHQCFVGLVAENLTEVRDRPFKLRIGCARKRVSAGRTHGGRSFIMSKPVQETRQYCKRTGHNREAAGIVEPADR